MPATAPNDVDLLARIAHGDREAFGQFYDHCSGILYSFALKVLHDPHEAEEALQEAMLLIWERAGAYSPSAGKPLSWAIAITRNRSIDRLRSTRRKSQLIQDATPEIASNHPGTADTADRATLQNEAATLVGGALGDLPTEQRHAIELAFFGGLTQTEIAEQLGEPLGTIKARIRRGMMTLRDILQGQL